MVSSSVRASVRLRASALVCSKVSAVRPPAATRQSAASTTVIGCRSANEATTSTTSAASENRIGTSSAANPPMAAGAGRCRSEPASGTSAMPTIHSPSTQDPSTYQLLAPSR